MSHQFRLELFIPSLSISSNNYVYYFTLTACEDGAIKLENNLPTIYKDGDWHPLCGECFQVTDLGIKEFCKELGFESGFIWKNNQTVIQNGINQNSTNANETLAIESHCSSLNITSRLEEKGVCTKGTDTIEIECLKSNSLFQNRTSSC